jgi:glycosyltransferase involved in cell wall biosynthesis
MRVLQVTGAAYRSGGGVSEHVINISQRLAKTHEVTVYATNPNDKLPGHEVIDDVEVFRFHRIAPNNSFYFSLDMIKQLRRSEFDIVHGHGFNALPMHFSDLAKHKRLFITPHYHGSGHTFYRNALFNVFKWYGRRILDRSNKIIAVSEYEKVLLLKDLNIPDEKVTVIPNGIKKGEFTKFRPIPHSNKVILYVGRLERYKGILNILEIMPKLNEDTVLEIVGKGPLKNEVLRVISDLNIEKRVSLFENLSRDDLLERYAGADLFILLSRYEAYSLVVAEALSSGLKCILTKTSALTEWVDEKTCYGVQYPINNLELLNLTKQILSENRVSGLKNKKQILDWDEVVDNLNSLYET